MARSRPVHPDGQSARHLTKYYSSRLLEKGPAYTSRSQKFEQSPRFEAGGVYLSAGAGGGCVESFGGGRPQEKGPVCARAAWMMGLGANKLMAIEMAAGGRAA